MTTKNRLYGRRAGLPAIAFSCAALAVLSAPASAQEDRGLPQLTPQSIMGDPLPDLTVSELDRFVKGKAEFNHILTEAEGLGPIMNDTGCGQCHSQPRVGGFSSRAVTRFGKAAIGLDPFDPLDSLGGSLLQVTAIDKDCLEEVPPEATVTAERTTPHVLGAGLVESIPSADIEDLENNPPHINVAGVTHMVTPLEGGAVRAGRFGWKAQVATLLTFSADAGLNEMGLTNRFLGTENAPNGDLALLALCDNVADPEDGPDGEGFDRIDRMTDFQRFLAPPAQTPRSGMTGEALFNQVNCNACHVASFTTGVAPEAALSNKVIQPYSDFLLHDVIGDGIVQGPGTETKIKTAPLWGVNIRAGTGLFHDGRVSGGSAEQNLHDSIMQHDGEATFSQAAYANLLTTEQDEIHRFLMSLGRSEFDLEGNITVDEIDWFLFWLNGYFAGPGAGGYTADDDAAIGDIDEDGDMDLVDFAYMQRTFTGVLLAD